MNGIPINSPDILKDIPADERHIIICIKGYNGVVNQLKDMGITDYHIYDPGNDYENDPAWLAEKEFLEKMVRLWYFSHTHRVPVLRS